MSTKIIVVLCIFCCSALSVRAQSQTISYQGSISNASGLPVDSGTYSIRVTFYSDEGGTHPLWQDTYATEVRKGIFNIALGSNQPLPKAADMDGPIWVGTSINGTVESRPLARLGAVPFAMNVADSSITASKLATDYVSSITVNGQQVTGKGTPLNIATGNGLDATIDPGTNTLLLTTGGTNARNGKGDAAQSGPGTAWVYQGNALGTPSDDYFGTNGNQPVWIRVNGGIVSGTDTGTVMRYYPIIGGTPDIIGGSSSNGIPTTPQPQGIVIAGGGTSSEKNQATGEFASIGGGSANNSVRYGSIGGGEHNTVKTDFGTVGGGLLNTAGDATNDDSYATVAGGRQNEAREEYSTIAGGDSNSALSAYTSIGGGQSNFIVEESTWAAHYSTIAGGSHNAIYDQHSFIGGGDTNTIYHNADYGVIVGGQGNLISTSSDVDNNNLAYSSILGGQLNTITGKSSSVLGGRRLKLKDYSVGFNGDTLNKTVDVSAFNHTAYFGDVNLWIGNIDNTARQLRFYSPNTDTDYSSSDFSSFQAGTQTQNIVYTLPTILPTPGQVLTATAVTSPNVTLAWTDSASGGGGGAGWLLHGNSSVPPPGFYLGTNDSEAFEIHVHNNTLDTSGGNQRVMRYEEGATSPNILGGSSANTLGPGLSGAAILSGGSLANPNILQGPFSVIVGGDSNAIYNLGADHNVIGGGLGNIEQNPSFGVISGGVDNLLDTAAWGSTVAGGSFNIVQPPLSFIGGGQDNKIEDIGWAYCGVLVGGAHNRVWHGVNSFMGGGSKNFAGYANSVLVGGDSNVTFGGDHSFLGGGLHNKIDWGSDTSTLVGGANNLIGGSGKWSFLGGGLGNTIGGPRSVIGGGCDNVIGPTKWGTIVGGCGNYVLDTLGFIGGGTGNVDSGVDATIGGGYANHVYAPAGTIGGGQSNFLDSTAEFSAITGGDTNTIFGSLNVIAGGYDNLVGGYYSAISGGYSNTINNGSQYSTVSGGYKDTVSSYYATIAGGRNNFIDNSSPWSSIGGGDSNLIRGGYKNVTIPGGDHLIAQSYGQTVVGFYNVASGSTTDTSSAKINGNDPLFIVGNGGNVGGHTVRSDAAFVTNRGTFSVFGQASSGGAQSPAPTTTGPARIGTTYSDNTIEAWGNVAAAANSTLADVGVLGVAHGAPGSGLYTITLNVKNQDGSAHTFVAGMASITASVGTGLAGAAGMVSVGTLSGGTSPTFVVNTFNAAGHPSDDYGFQFHVVAR